MTLKEVTIKEMVDHINSSFAIDWGAEAAHIIGIQDDSSYEDMVVSSD